MVVVLLLQIAAEAREQIMTTSRTLLLVRRFFSLFTGNPILNGFALAKRVEQNRS
jgi:hypothetical protein